MILPGTRALRTLEAAGRHLNFTRAAEELGLTPAAVSYQIREIEDQLDLVLFTRTSRSIRPTPAGTELIEAAREALGTLRVAVSRARKVSRGPGHLRLSLGARFATNWLLPKLPELRSEHPGLALTFDITDEVRDFGSDDVDIAIRFGSGHWKGARADRLFDTVIAPICAPRLIAAGSAPRDPSDLCRHTLCYVDRTSEGTPWPDWRMWMAAAGIEDFDNSDCIAFSDSSHVVQAVVDSPVIGLVDLEMVGTELSQGRVVRLFDIGLAVGANPADRDAPGHTYHLVYPQSLAQDPRLVSFRRWLLARQPTDGIRPPSAPAT